MPVFAGIMAGISAAASLGKGIAGAAQASSQNARARANYEAQQQAAENAALVQNQYNRLAFEAEKLNYQQQREYEWQTAVQNWQYQTEIQDFEYLQTAKQYLGSIENTQQQLTYNSIAAREAKEQEQASLAEILNNDAFQREGMIIERLQNEGRASLLQAGGSRTKSIQSTVAEQGRNAAILTASLVSAGQQSQRNMRDIEMGRYASDLKARNAMMIEPERLPDMPKPIKPPERMFVEPMYVNPAFTPRPAQQNIFAPLVSGLAGTANTLMSAAEKGGAFGYE
jgi:hypothetical protein